MVQRFAENYETNQSSSESAREFADRAKDVALMRDNRPKVLSIA